MVIDCCGLMSIWGYFTSLKPNSIPKIDIVIPIKCSSIKRKKKNLDKYLLPPCEVGMDREMFKASWPAAYLGCRVRSWHCFSEIISTFSVWHKIASKSFSSGETLFIFSRYFAARRGKFAQNSYRIWIICIHTLTYSHFALSENFNTACII